LSYVGALRHPPIEKLNSGAGLIDPGGAGIDAMCNDQAQLTLIFASISMEKKQAALLLLKACMRGGGEVIIEVIGAGEGLYRWDNSTRMARLINTIDLDIKNQPGLSQGQAWQAKEYPELHRAPFEFGHRWL